MKEYVISMLLLSLFLFSAIFFVACDEETPPSGASASTSSIDHSGDNKPDNSGPPASSTPDDSELEPNPEPEPKPNPSLYQYRIENGEVHIEKYIGTESFVVIPSIINGYTVIGIDEDAFDGCDFITNISLPKSITHIGEDVFEDCINLIYNTYDNALYLGNKDNPFLVLIRAKNIKIQSCIIHEDTKLIGWGAFGECINITNIAIPDSVKHIGDYAFAECYKLKNIKLPEGITHISNHMFDECVSLTKITIPKGVTSIGENAFVYCTSLTDITIPDNVIRIGEYAFYECNSIIRLTIGRSVTDIGAYAFYCNKLAEINNFSSLPIAADSDYKYGIPPRVLNIYTPTNGKAKTWATDDGFVFYEDEDVCYLLGYTGDKTEITLPESCNNKPYGIYINAFNHCKALTDVTIPDNVMFIYDDAFAYCQALDSVTFTANSKLESIWGNAFSGCRNLTTITIPNNVISIDDYAFSHCTNLIKVTIGQNVTSITERAFYDCPKLVEIYNLSSLSGDIEHYAHNVYTPTSGATRLFTTDDGYIFYEYYDSYENMDFCYLLKYTGNKSNISLPSNCRGKNYKISSYVFYDCKLLESVSIPDGVTGIGECAFHNCSSLKTITIPASVTDIDESAFYGCNSLTSVNFSKSGQLTYIGSHAFAGCEALVRFTIPKSVRLIGCFAFSGCSNLKDIYCETEEKPDRWDNYWNDYCSAIVHWGYVEK